MPLTSAQQDFLNDNVFEDIFEDQVMRVLPVSQVTAIMESVYKEQDFTSVAFFGDENTTVKRAVEYLHASYHLLGEQQRQVFQLGQPKARRDEEGKDIVSQEDAEDHFTFKQEWQAEFKAGVVKIIDEVTKELTDPDPSAPPMPESTFCYPEPSAPPKSFLCTPGSAAATCEESLVLIEAKQDSRALDYLDSFSSYIACVLAQLIRKGEPCLTEAKTPETLRGLGPIVELREKGLTFSYSESTTERVNKLEQCFAANLLVSTGASPHTVFHIPHDRVMAFLMSFYQGSKREALRAQRHMYRRAKEDGRLPETFDYQKMMFQARVIHLAQAIKARKEMIKLIQPANEKVQNQASSCSIFAKHISAGVCQYIAALLRAMDPMYHFPSEVSSEIPDDENVFVEIRFDGIFVRAGNSRLSNAARTLLQEHGQHINSEDQREVFVIPHHRAGEFVMCIFNTDAAQASIKLKKAYDEKANTGAAENGERAVNCVFFSDRQLLVNIAQNNPVVPEGKITVPGKKVFFDNASPYVKYMRKNDAGLNPEQRGMLLAVIAVVDPGSRLSDSYTKFRDGKLTRASASTMPALRIREISSGALFQAQGNNCELTLPMEMKPGRASVQVLASTDPDDKCTLELSFTAPGNSSSAELEPQNLIVIIDRSGSMDKRIDGQHSTSIERSRISHVKHALVDKCIPILPPGSYIQVLSYSDYGSIEYQGNNMTCAQDAINKIQAYGRTVMCSALKKLKDYGSAKYKTEPTVLLFSDGQDFHTEQYIQSMVQQKLGKARMGVFAIGADYNGILLGSLKKDKTQLTLVPIPDKKSLEMAFNQIGTFLAATKRFTFSVKVKQGESVLREHKAELDMPAGETVRLALEPFDLNRRKINREENIEIELTVKCNGRVYTVSCMTTYADLDGAFSPELCVAYVNKECDRIVARSQEQDRGARLDRLDKLLQRRCRGRCHDQSIVERALESVQAARKAVKGDEAQHKAAQLRVEQQEAGVIVFEGSMSRAGRR